MNRRKSVSRLLEGEERPGFLQPKSAFHSGSFRLDDLSCNQLRFSSLGLYGREAEISQLWKAYEDVIPKRRKGVVMVSGYSGSGKSKLVKKLESDIRREARNERRSFFCAGKFDLHNRAEPFTALSTAFTMLCADLMLLQIDNVEVFTRTKNAILDAVGSEGGGVLMNMIPNITEILGHDMEAPHLSEFDGIRDKNRFYYVFRQFVRAVSEEAYPIVLFLDDLQWADTSSLELLEQLLIDPELSGLLLVGCYRDNEVEESHPLMNLLDDFDRRSNPQSGDCCSVTRVRADSLSVDSVHEMITDVLNVSDKSKTRTLATAVHKKTFGNVFFVIQFLKTLHDDGMLVYELGRMSWKWDDEEVISRAAAENVVMLLKTKLIKNLPYQVLEVLMLGACLGATFDRSTLVLVIKEIPKGAGLWAGDETKGEEQKPAEENLCRDIDECLMICIEEGFLEVASLECETDPSFRFVHDQIQLAVFSLIPEDKKDLLQYSIGNVLVKHLSADDLNTMVFVAVDLLNNGLDLVTTDEERESASRLNLKAGKKAMELSAFVSASRYLSTAISVLESNRWEIHYDLTLEIFNKAIKAEFGRGNVEKLMSYIEEVLDQNDRPLRDKFYAYLMLACCHSCQGHPKEALDTCFLVLNQLGVPCQPRFGKLSLIIELLKTKRLVRNYPMDKGSDLPIMDDENALMAMKTMKFCGIYAFMTRPELTPYVAMKQIQCSIHSGVSKFAPLAFAWYAALSLAVFRDIEEASRHGKFALSLSEKFPVFDRDQYTVNLFNLSLRHWVTPIHSVRKDLLKGYRESLLVGDVHHAMVRILNFCYACFITGEPLSRLEADLRVYAKQMEDYEQTVLLYPLLTIWQSVLNLMSRSDNPIELSGEAMDHESLLKICDENKLLQSKDRIKTSQFHLAFLFGRYDVAADLFDATKNVAKTSPCTILIWRNSLFEGLTAFSLARRGKRRWRKRAKKVLKKTRVWVKNGNVNCVHVQYLLEAEANVLAGKFDEAKKLYEAAIRTAARAGFRSDKAVACERAGEFFLETGDDSWATHYLTLAYENYVEWEAWAKCDHLRNKYPKYIPECNSGPRPSSLAPPRAA